MSWAEDEPKGEPGKDDDDDDNDDPINPLIDTLFDEVENLRLQVGVLHICNILIFSFLDSFSSPR